MRPIDTFGVPRRADGDAGCSGWPDADADGDGRIGATDLR